MFNLHSLVGVQRVHLNVTDMWYICCIFCLGKTKMIIQWTMSVLRLEITFWLWAPMVTLMMILYSAVWMWKCQARNFPSGPVIKTSVSGGMGSIPGWGIKIQHSKPTKRLNMSSHLLKGTCHWQWQCVYLPTRHCIDMSSMPFNHPYQRKQGFISIFQNPIV